MELLVNLLVVFNFVMFVAWVVVARAKRDREYAAAVRSEHERKSILRGRYDD